MHKMSKSATDIDRSNLLAIIDGKICIVQGFSPSGSGCGYSLDQCGCQSLSDEQSVCFGGCDGVRGHCSQGNMSLSDSVVSRKTQGYGHPQERKIKGATPAQFEIDTLPAIRRWQDNLAQNLVCSLCVW